MDLVTRTRARQLDEVERALAARLRDAGAAAAPVPTPEFREALRSRLMAVAAVQGIGETGTAPAPLRSAVSWRSRAAAIGAGVMATVVAASGVAVASSRSLPGDPFYGVKRATEAVQLRVAGDEQEEGTRHLQFAATRLREVRALVLGRDAAAGAVAAAPVPEQVGERVRDALADMDADTRAGVQLLLASFRSSRAPEPLQKLSRFATGQQAGLRGVLPALTGVAHEQAQQSLSLLEGVRATSDKMLMLVDCTAVCDPAQVAPAPPAAGAPTPPCSCPAPLPPPQTAPVPPTSPSGPAEPEPSPTPTAEGSSSPEPSSPPQPGPPPPSQSPQPSLPVPLPLPSAPVPPLPPVEPLSPTVEVPPHIARR